MTRTSFNASDRGELYPVAGKFASGTITATAKTFAELFGADFLPTEPGEYYVDVQIQGAGVYLREDGTAAAAADGSGFTLADNETIRRRAAHATPMSFISGGTITAVAQLLAK